MLLKDGLVPFATQIDHVVVRDFCVGGVTRVLAHDDFVVGYGYGAAEQPRHDGWVEVLGLLELQ